jgi:hypothetical protein
MIDHLPDRLASEHFRMSLRLLNRLRIVGPTRCQGRIAVFLVQRRPPVPAVRQQPQTMYKHHRLPPGCVHPFALRQLVLGDREIAGGFLRILGGHDCPPLDERLTPPTSDWLTVSRPHPLSAYLPRHARQRLACGFLTNYFDLKKSKRVDH